MAKQIVIRASAILALSLLCWIALPARAAEADLDHVEATVREILTSLGASATGCDNECGPYRWVCAAYTGKPKRFVEEWDAAAGARSVPVAAPERRSRSSNVRLYRQWDVAGTRVEVVYYGEARMIQVRIPFPEPAETGSEPGTAAPEPGSLHGGPLVIEEHDLVNPVILREWQVAPCYPELARRARLTGTVELHAIVTKDGTVIEAEVLRSSRPNVGFEEAALEAVRHWRYRPATLDGEPVDVYFTINVDFDLQ